MLNEVSDADFDNYITELENNKFSQIENVDEEIEGEGYISTGTLYSNGTTSVSMSLADGTLPKEERIAAFLHQIKNPYRFRCGDFVVNAAFASNGVTLEECLQGILR